MSNHPLLKKNKPFVSKLATAAGTLVNLSLDQDPILDPDKVLMLCNNGKIALDRITEKALKQQVRSEVSNEA